MRFIPTALHGVVDYIVGLFLAGLPLYLGWPARAQATFIAIGLVVIGYSAFTDYEFGVFRYLGGRLHLFLDALIGVLLLASPFLLSLPDNHYALVVAIGTLALVLAATTEVRAKGNHSQADFEVRS
jgi:hypothetical protein